MDLGVFNYMNSRIITPTRFSNVCEDVLLWIVIYEYRYLIMCIITLNGLDVFNGFVL